MQRIFHTPEGVRDIYGTECVQKKELEDRLHRVFSLHGFADIETPSFEFFEVFSNEVGTIPSSELYKFFDRENNTLVLRPDFTPSISRACAAHFSPDEHPVNLCYTGNAFINPSRYQGRLRETTQMGVEKMGDDSPQADAEILAMAVECLIASGLKEFQISIGQVDFFKSLLEEADPEPEIQERLRELISQKNYFAVEDLVRTAGFEEKTARAFFMLPQMFGSVEILDSAASLTDNPGALAAVERLREIYTYLEAYGYDRYVTFDFGMLRKYQYYTGIIFQGYTYGTGEPLIKGGRYDRLLKHFGKDAPSVGFVIVVDSLLAALAAGGARTRQDSPLVLRYRACDTCETIRQAQRLRQEGRRVIMELERGENA